MTAKQPHLAVWSTVRKAFLARTHDASALRDRQAQERLERLERHLRRVADAIRVHDREIDALEQLLRARWDGVTLKRGSVKHKVEGAALALEPPGPIASGPAARGTGTIQGVAESLRGTAMPLRAVRRAAAFDQELTDAIRAIASVRDLQVSAAAKAMDEAVRAAPGVSRALPGQTRASKQLNERLRLPPGIADSISHDLLKVRPGHGPLVVQCGWLHDRGGNLLSVHPAAPVQRAGLTTVTTPLPGPDLWVPALLDLDQDGGVATTDRGTANSLLIRLLALLPAGQLKLHVFDPLRLGESVKYLFQLNDAAEKVIGDKVASTTTELRSLLEATERHITYVTQKYLGARHRSLHEYNLAAGEVAEPYRVLVIFDHPNGFSRPGSGMDPELHAQLEKVVGAGPRCGVYTVLHSSGGSSLPWSLPQLEEGLTGMRLPHLAAPLGKLVSHATLASPPDAQGLASQLGSGRPTGLLGLSSQFVWRPGRVDPASGPAIAALMTRIERDLHSSASVEVSPDRVADLAAKERAERQRKALPVGAVVSVPSDEATWWKGTSSDGVVARIGRKGSSSVAEVRLDSSEAHAHLLVGGKPGSGKSVFLHALIGDLTRTYPPDQLELYLLDVKFGVEFKAYTRSPHARVVALESGREFGVSVLSALVDKMEARSKRFKKAGVSAFSEYRAGTTRPMPRVVAVIDEFHGLFETDDPVGDEAARLLRRVIKQGRALGVHVVLGSQTVTGAILMPRDALGLISQRVVFSSSDQDSRLLLADDNSEAVQLDRPGEGILNLRGGRRDANERFQATLLDRKGAEVLTRSLAARSARAGQPFEPLVFDGVAECPVTPDVRNAVLQPAEPLKPSLPIGMPMGLGGARTVTFRRSAGGHLLVVATPARTVPLLTLAGAIGLSGAVDVEILDYDGAGSELETAMQPLLRAAGRPPAGRGPGTVALLQGPETRRALEAGSQLVAQRVGDGDLRSRSKLLVLSGLDAAAELRLGAPAGDALGAILVDGAAVGVHVMMVARRLATVERCLDIGGLDHFDLRVSGVASREDSNRLLDDPIASDIVEEQLVVGDRAEPRPVVVRAFAAPPANVWAG